MSQAAPLATRAHLRKSNFERCTQGCGRYTRASTGICDPCRRGHAIVIPEVSHMDDSTLVQLVTDAVEELKRRETRFREVIRLASAFGGGEP